MKSFSALIALTCFLFSLIWISIRPAQSERLAAYAYLSPPPNAEYVNALTTLGIRHGDPINAATVTDDLFTIVGSKSGLHSGETFVAGDDTTIIFVPDEPFTRLESLTITIDSGVETTSGLMLAGTTYTVTVSGNLIDVRPLAGESQAARAWGLPLDERAQTESAPFEPQTTYQTLPDDFPLITVTHPADGADDGYIFLGTFRWGEFGEDHNYLLILDDNGDPVYAKAVDSPPLDFKAQPNGTLTYGPFPVGPYVVMDNTYTEVDAIRAGNGYLNDFHELLMSPDDHAILMVYDNQPVDMSQVVTGGNPDAIVTGLIVQELDADRNVIFEWRSWDHMEITDTEHEDLLGDIIDYAHGNSIEVDTDGNWLISSRHIDEVTKIDRNTADIIWRMGGTQNEFTLLFDDEWFAHQHDVRRLANGNISLFDNRTPFGDYSRVVEYEVDEDNRIATKVREYRLADPDSFAVAMGGSQPLGNGNWLIGWGSRDASPFSPVLTEVKPDGSKAFELTLPHEADNVNFRDVSYRAYRFEWEGVPEDPVLVLGSTDETGTALFFSANGVTDPTGERYDWRIECVSASGWQVADTLDHDQFESWTDLFLDYLPACTTWRAVLTDTETNATYISNTLAFEQLFIPLMASEE